MADISFNGLASGLPTNDIIAALIDVERIPIVRAQSRRSELQSRSQAFSDLSTRLEALRTALREIDTPGELSRFSASSSDEDLLRVTASGNARQGTYRVIVDQLANNRVEASSAVTDASTIVGSGDLDLTVGTTTTRVSLGAGATLGDIANAINEANAGVTASVIFDGTANRLTVSANTSGAAGFTLDDSSFVGLNGFDPTFEVLSAGQDAQIRVNGLTVTRSSNTITDVIDGLTLDLRAADPASTVALTINSDDAAIRASLNGFIEAYNAVQDLIGQQSRLDSSGEPTGVLFGDSGVRSIQSSLRSATQSFSANNGSFFNSLASIGIRSDSTGRLSLNASVFDEALTADREGVINLFTESGTGIAAQFDSAIENLVNPNTGLIKSRRDGLSNRIRSFDRQITRLEDRIVRVEDQLRQRYAALETQISQLQAQGQALTGALSSGR